MRDSYLHSAFKSIFKRLEIASFFEEGPPLRDSDWGFVVSEHGGGMVDKVGDILLGCSCDESCGETCMAMGIPLW